MDIPIGLLIDKAAQFGIELNRHMVESFTSYARILVEYNKKVNLTNIVQPKDIVIKHFLDSLAVIDAVSIPENARLIDVGTGAGFPGVPIKIVRPDIELTLLDSLNKRINFLKQLISELGLNNVHTVHARAEEAGRKPGFRHAFDVATARAVAALPVLCEYCIPLVKPNGLFITMKGREVEQELQSAQNAIAVLGARVEKVKTFNLPDGSGRSNIIIKKISQTPSIYPRKTPKILKSPL